jgi:hypothetical protein
VAQAILDNKPVGIATSGTTTQAATDANGFSTNVKFTRPVLLPVYLVFDIVVDAGLFPADGAALIKQAVADYGDETYTVGTEVRGSALLPSVFAAVPGVLESGLPKIGVSPSPTLTTTLVVNLRQYAELDTSRITVNVIAVTPE